MYNMGVHYYCVLFTVYIVMGTAPFCDANTVLTLMLNLTNGSLRTLRKKTGISESKSLLLVKCHILDSSHPHVLSTAIYLLTPLH